MNKFNFKSNKKLYSMTSQDIFTQMTELFNQFTVNHNGTSKAAKMRARKDIGDLKKLVTEYRKASVEESKA